MQHLQKTRTRTASLAKPAERNPKRNMSRREPTCNGAVRKTYCLRIYWTDPSVGASNRPDRQRYDLLQSYALHSLQTSRNFALPAELGQNQSSGLEDQSQPRRCICTDRRTRSVIVQYRSMRGEFWIFSSILVRLPEYCTDIVASRRDDQLQTLRSSPCVCVHLSVACTLRR